MASVATQLASHTKSLRGLRSREILAIEAGVKKNVLNSIEHRKFYEARIEDVLKVIDTLLEMPNIPEEQKKKLCEIYRKIKPKVARTHRCFCHKHQRAIRR